MGHPVNKVFEGVLINGNASKFSENASKKRGNTSAKLSLKSFFQITETPLNFTETPQKKETAQLNRVTKIRKLLKNFAKTPQKYWEIP